MKATQFIRTDLAILLICVSLGCGKTESVTTTPGGPPSKSVRAAHQKPPLVASDGHVRVAAHDITSPQSHSTATESIAVPHSTPPQPIHRPDDARPRHDDRRLASMGIHLFESKHLKLYTDIETEAARSLPPLVDAVHGAWINYFGDLPPDRAGSEFQMTGYLIQDESLFREAGLVPEDLPMFEHGRHRRNEFWMREQKYDYFRRHLLLHEATHCFMTYMPDVDAPVWYIEGMAEYFATHRIEESGLAQFCIMPTSPEEVAGWGRVTGIRTEFAAAKALTIPVIISMPPTEFLKPEPYAWSWALCLFLDTHPHYRDRFRRLSRHLQRNAFIREFNGEFTGNMRELATEWQLFVTNLQYGYEATLAAIDFQLGKPLSTEEPSRRIEISANRGWQSSGVWLEAGRKYDITASGRATLSNQPKPWDSEPQGITFRYSHGKPLGRLVGCLLSDSEQSSLESESMLKVFDIGSGCRLEAARSGTLYLRINDEWNSLSNNTGSFSVLIDRAETSD